jgi:phosphoribosylamine--glycine ligase
MRENRIPTAEYGVFADYELALKFLTAFDRSVVVKADGLAAGKGVLICDSVDEAKMALKQIMLDRVFGEAGDRVVIEERLNGREISVLAFSDGKTVVPMIVSRDHKRALDGDQGLNTGGMGAFAPTTDVSQEYIDRICRDVLQQVIDGMNKRGTPYVGVLYAGLMIDGDEMNVLEFNCRFGDPETQVVLPLLDSDLYEIVIACIAERLSEIEIKWKSASCATVVLASPGYPQSYSKGLPISGLDVVDDENVIVFHAGTTRKNGQLITSGGRVLAVTGIGADLDKALFRVYTSIGKIHFDKMHYRRDIGRTT